MHAINSKTKSDIYTFLDFIGADLAIIDYNIVENQDMTESQKNEYRKEVKKLREHVYETAKKFL